MAHAAESPEAAVLASAPSIVVVPSNVLSACCVAVKETVTELSLCPEFTTVEPPEVSVVSTCESLSCPVTAMEAVCESLFCPVTAMEAVSDSLSCPVTAMEAVCESSSCPVTAMEAVCESIDDFLVFSAMDALSVSCVSVFPRSQSLPWSSGPSAPPRRSSAPLYVMEGTMNAERYIKVLEQHMLPSRRRVFQQDNAKPHTAAITTA